MAQGRLLGSHEQHLQQLNRTMEELIQSLRSLQPPTPPAARTDPTPAPLTATGPPPSSLPFAVPLSIPDKYDGTPDLCQGFLMQCSLYFSRAPTAFPSEDAKIAFVLSLLTGKALRWATAVWGAQSSVMQTYASFEHQFKEVFDHSGTGKDPGEQLLHLKQGNSTALDFSLTFRTLAAESGWDDQALKTVYRNGLNEQLKSELACKDDAQTLDGLIKLSIRLDNLIRSRRQVYSSITTPASQTTEPEEMECDRARVTPEEKQRRFREGLCFYCGEKGHFRQNCKSLRRTSALRVSANVMPMIESQSSKYRPSEAQPHTLYISIIQHSLPNDVRRVSAKGSAAPLLAFLSALLTSKALNVRERLLRFS
ncbi:hypothetical protein MHYP_G00095030 [Metynnis hypsauchen]